MMTMTRKTDYGMVALARLVEQQASDGKPLSARQIALQYGLPLPIVTKSMKALQRAGLVKSMRGPRGGYVLGENAAWISVADVVEALEGPVKVVPCCEDSQGNACPACQVVTICPITKRMRQLNQRIYSFLRQVSLKDLMTSEVIDPLATQPVGALRRADHLEVNGRSDAS